MVAIPLQPNDRGIDLYSDLLNDYSSGPCRNPLTLKMARKPASENVVCFMWSAEYSCKLFKPVFAYRQTVWTLIRLLLEVAV